MGTFPTANRSPQGLLSPRSRVSLFPRGCAACSCVLACNEHYRKERVLRVVFFNNVAQETHSLIIDYGMPDVTWWYGEDRV